MKTDDFILGEISNELRYALITDIGDIKNVKSFELKIQECKTNKKQNALYFTLHTDYLQIAKNKIYQIVENLKKEFSFDVKVNELAFEFTNIKAK